jgi:hypothetical protein
MREAYTAASAEFPLKQFELVSRELFVKTRAARLQRLTVAGMLPFYANRKGAERPREIISGGVR